jgi:hypothetical protein
MRPDLEDCAFGVLVVMMIALRSIDYDYGQARSSSAIGAVEGWWPMSMFFLFGVSGFSFFLCSSSVCFFQFQNVAFFVFHGFGFPD